MAAAVAAAVRRREEDSPKSNAPSATLQKSRSQTALDLPPLGKGFWKYQQQSAVAYTSLKVQLSVATLIASNFLMNIIEKWIDPDGDQYPEIWVGTDLFFNVSFALELVWNMYSFWLCRFWRSAWNVFDVIVVTIGLMNYVLPDLPGPLSLLRMMRAFRVFRLFKRVESLHKIMKSLSRAIPGVANAFLILLLVMSIYAILGVEFFGSFANGGNFTNEFDEVVPILTARDLPFGDENFGNFHRSLFTMFQVLTGESWSEVVTRPMLHTTDVTQAMGVSAFFVSFNLVNGLVLINVVIAVLLEKMVDDEKPHEPAEELPEDTNGFHLDESTSPDGGQDSCQDEAKKVGPEDTEETPATSASSVQKHAMNGEDKGKAAIQKSFTTVVEVKKEADKTALKAAHMACISAMESDFQSLKKDMAKIKRQMDVLMKEVWKQT
mmetsp:Transcript_4580/g.10724  ORF Transcript_4580/g.10724 Transcript_4580/m.10724 type:complete len:436 (+) Transcript_4580:69-1376(+)